MLKAILCDKKPQIMDLATDVVDTSMDDYCDARHAMERYFTANKLDGAIINHLYALLFSYGAGVCKPLSIREFMDLHLDSEPEINEMIKCFFHGVDKGLPVPTILIRKILTGLNNSDKTLAENIGKSQAIPFHPDDVAKFNPKNIMTYCGYPERDAKALFKSLHIQGIGMYLPKSPIFHEALNDIAIYNFSTPPMYSWHVESILDYEKLQEAILHTAFTVEELEALMHDIPLPITSLKLWRVITKEWYEREKKRDWNTLSAQAQQRHLVNMIRHGSIGYSQCYTNLPRVLSDLLHEAAFNRIMRQIANTFPFLRNECQKQWDFRDNNSAT